MGVPTMAQARTFVALDVHVSGTVAAIIDRDSGELRRQGLSGRGSEVCEFVAALPGPVRATYEAGPTGFALARRLQAAGVDCLVCAPGLIPRPWCPPPLRPAGASGGYSVATAQQNPASSRAAATAMIVRRLPRCSSGLRWSATQPARGGRGVPYLGIDWGYRRAAFCALSAGGAISGEGFIAA